ncbi:hypothetical protein [Hungatella sp.]
MIYREGTGSADRVLRRFVVCEHGGKWKKIPYMEFKDYSACVPNTDYFM